jgi:PAS domain S-box-containing protein
MKACLAILTSIFLRNAAVKIACIYAIFTVLWVLFFDQILFFYFKEAVILARIQTLKDWVFILITSLIVYSLLQREITKSKQAEDKSIESERKLFTLMSNLPGMAYRCRNDEDWTMEFVSDGCLKLTGYQPADLIGNRRIAYNNLIHPDDQQFVWEKVQYFQRLKTHFQFTYRIRTEDGKEKWVWEQGTGIFSKEGSLLALEGFITDITKEKQADEALHIYRSHLEDLVKERTQTLEQEVVEKQHAEKKFRDLLESAPDAMALVDQQGTIVLVNRQMENLFDYSREDLLKKNIEILIPERFRKKHREHIRDYFALHPARPMGALLDIFALPKDGKEFPADISLSPFEMKEGLFVLIDIRDITKRKQAQEKIKKSYYFESTINSVLKISLKPLSLKEQLEQILDSILAIPILSLQNRGSIYLVEDKAELLVIKAQRGYSGVMLADCSRIPFGECLCGKAAKTSTAIFADCLGKCHKCYKGIFPHGHYCIPIVSGPNVLGLLNLILKEGHKRDKHEEEFLSTIGATIAGIIEHKKTELEKEKLQDQLSESEKLSALGRMMANVAHEIRNPLTALGGLTRRLDKKMPGGTKEKEYTKVILSESTRLERILTSVLTFTKEPSAHRKESNINDVIDDSLQLLEMLFKEKSIDVQKSFTAPLPVLIAREEVRGVLDNILLNALDATPTGGKIIIATGQEYIDEMVYSTVKLTDTGTGIQEDKLRKIFEPFFTMKPVGTGHGIGLGLSISKKIMEDHGGLIRVRSKIGEGTTFTLYFPFQGSSAPSPT